MTGVIAALSAFSRAILISITDRTVTRTAAGTANATYELNSDGNVTALEIWCSSNGVAAPSATGGYESRATLQSGVVPTVGTMGTWENLGTTRRWTVTNSAEDDSTLVSVILVEIREASTLTVKDSATITIRATSTS